MGERQESSVATFPQTLGVPVPAGTPSIEFGISDKGESVDSGDVVSFAFTTVTGSDQI